MRLDKTVLYLNLFSVVMSLFIFTEYPFYAITALIFIRWFSDKNYKANYFIKFMMVMSILSLLIKTPYGILERLGYPDTTLFIVGFISSIFKTFVIAFFYEYFKQKSYLEKEGIRKTYSASGWLWKEETYKNGQLEGVSKAYRENGHLSREDNYKNGKLEGISKVYYENGKLMWEDNYENGQLEGISKRYYENGELAWEDNYKNGKLEGVSKRYHENGHLKHEGYYENGQLEGISKVYYENGQLEHEKYYKNGVVIG